MGEKQAEKARLGADNGQTEREDQVRLKPILGLRPGIYLAVIYSVILLVILFFILVYPGLLRPGSLVVLKTEPAGAALRVDGVYRGTAPDTVFVSRGKHTLELVLPGFTTEWLEREIPGRLLFSALFPRRYPLEVTLTAPDPAAAFIAAAKDYAAWTFGGEPTAAWQIPLSLSEGAYRVAFRSREPEELLKAASRFAVTGAALRDLLRAKTIADNGGLPPSPLSLARSAADIIGFLSENPGSAVWLAQTLPAESTNLITASSWYQAQLAAFAEVTAEESLAPPPLDLSSFPPARLRVGGLSFTGLAAGTLVQGEPFPHAVSIEGFMISDTEVPSSLFAEFLEDNPRWRADQREALAAEELVSGDYLVDDGNALAGPETGVTGVSWYAARAFCAWLRERLPPSMNGYEVRLPAETEWEYAAKSTKRWAAAGAETEIKNMEDGAWEWCLDPYAPLAFINAAPEGIAAIDSPERAVRGGSPFNPAGSVTGETRASLPPAFCSPFVSFRAVIARRAVDFPAQPAIR